jgi:hypothetical protein
MRLSFFLLLGLFLVVSAPAVYAQGGTGTMTGIVMDSAGAVISGASVQAVRAETGQVYQVSTTETGNYTIAPLPIGKYDLNVTVQGFKKYTHANIQIEVAQILREDVQLEIGTSSESVTVTAEASLLKTESGELSHEVTVTQMQELPILSVGGGGSSATSGFRNPWSVALLIPGTQFVSNSSMNVNGSNTSYSIRVEGMDAQMDGANIIYTQRVQPSVDAIQEVAIQTSNFAAEFGTVGGGLFNVSMKSGSNQLHGNVYDYMVNEALNAHQPYTERRSAQRRHDYGFTAGGPVYIPKVYNGKNRTFFFWSFEQFRENINWHTPPSAIGGGQGTYPTVPIPDYRGGKFAQVIAGSGVNGVPRNVQVSAGRDYVDPLGRTIQSGTIFDPLSERSVICSPAITANCAAGTSVLVRDPFPNNTINATRFDKVALAIQDKYIPQPTIASQLGQNYSKPWLADRVSNLPSVKIDQQVSSKGRLSGYWQHTGTSSQYSTPNGNMEGFPAPITVARGTFIYTKLIRINYDHTITPTLLGHLGAGYFQQDFDDHAPVTDFDASKELGIYGATMVRTFPQIAFTPPTLSTGGMSNMGPSFQGPSKEIKPQANANLSWVRRNHTFKFGSEWRATGYPTYTFTSTSGVFTFGSPATGQTALQNVSTSQGSTGFSYASYLLGLLTANSLNAPIAAKTGQQQWSLFAQDTWKVTRKLTVDYGLRWDYGTYSREQYGRYGSFAAALPNPSAGGYPGATQYEAVCQCNFAQSYPYALGPRLGVAYQVMPKTVLRGGFGMVYAPVGVVSGSSTNSAAAGTVAFDQFLPVSLSTALLSLHPVWPAFDPASNATPGTVVTAPTYIDPNAARPSRQYQWSFGIQREITRNLVAEASYVANRVVWLSAANLAPLNAVSQQILAKYGFGDFNSASDAALLGATISSLSAAQRAALAARGMSLIPYGGFPTNQTVRQALMPYPQFSTITGVGITPSGAPLGKSWYDSLQVTVTKRLSHGLSLNSNFTWSKALSLTTSPDVFNRELGKTLNTTDLPFQFRISADYITPRIKSGPKAFTNKFVSTLLADWGVGWYSSYQSAAILNRPTSTGGATSIDKFLGRGPGQAQYIAGQPLYSVDWTDLSGVRHTDELDINCHCFDPTKNIVLNPKAWANVPDGRWGAQQGVMRNFRGFRYPQENANISRTIRIKERMNLQLRVEFQNIFNRTQLPQPVALTTTNFQSTPTQANGMYTGGFGAVVPTGGTGNFRTGLLIGRFTF